MKKSALSRRKFIHQASLGAAAFSIVPRFVLGGSGYIAPSDTLYLAGVGVGGKGESDLAECSKSPNVKVSYLCDVDDRAAVQSRKAFPAAKYYKDFRVMLDKESKHIDALTISTPDHTHATIAMAAMTRGKHVYVQKPLTWSIQEARLLTETARRYSVVTQMGNQGGSSDGVRRMNQMYTSGLIGEVNKIVAWTNRPIWPQGIPRPQQVDPVPAELDWDLWLGPASSIPYNDKAYVPFAWRGWTGFGTGALGDMACHVLDPAFRILKLDFPTQVECSSNGVWTAFLTEGNFPESFPSCSILHFLFPGKAGKPDVKLTWMDGGLLPERPEELEADQPMGDWNGGIIFEGSKGKIMADCYGQNPRLLPLKKMEDWKPAPLHDAVPEGHYLQWVNACLKGYTKTELSSSFDFAGPFTETVLLGTVAIKSYQMKIGKGFPGRKKLLWDAKNLKVTNFDEANSLMARQYRNGWTL